MSSLAEHQWGRQMLKDTRWTSSASHLDTLIPLPAPATRVSGPSPTGPGQKCPIVLGVSSPSGGVLAVSGASRAQLTATDQPTRISIVNRPVAASLNDPCFEPSNFAYSGRESRKHSLAARQHRALTGLDKMPQRKNKPTASK